MADILPWSAHGGVTTHSKNEIRSFCRKILEGERYREALEKSLIDRSIPPAVETLLYHYAYGKPVENVNVNVSTDFSNKTPAELRDLLAEMQKRLVEVEAIQEAITVDVLG